ncbi:MAG TPA: ABC transporter permease [Longimicrobiaceae bacterium]|nr:ABC transporter permease [Longimicrobiaceae bacterium]
MSGLLQDLRYAARQLTRSPGFALVAVLTLALGIGANAALFGVVDVLLLRPPAGVREPGSVVRLMLREPATEARPALFGRTVSYPDYRDIRDGSRSFSSLAAQAIVPESYGRGGRARQVQAVFASSNYFSTLGVRAAVGALFTPGEDRGYAPAAVLSYDFWQREFGGDPGVIGHTIQLGTERLPVVGVAPEGFRGVELKTADVWIPLAMSGKLGFSPDPLRTRNISWLKMFGRLRPGVSAARAAAEATAVVRGIDAAPPPGVSPPDRSAWSVAVTPITDHFDSSGNGQSPVPVWLLGVTGALLLIACANVANLLLARGMARRREVAVRMAVGAGRGRIVRQLIVESLVLALLAGAVGVLVAAWAASLLKLLPLPDSLPPVLGTRVFLFTLVVAVAAGLLFGVVPALSATRLGIEGELRATSTRATPRRSLLRNALVVGQLAISLVLLVGAGLFLRSLRNVQQIDLGWDIDHVLIVNADLHNAGYSEARSADLWRRAEERIRALPGVAGVSLAQGVPFFSFMSSSTVLPGQSRSEVRMTGTERVEPGYFRTMGIPLRAGRGFDASDRADSARTAIVDEALARLYWPGESALGKCFLPGVGGQCIRVVGVVGNTRRQGIQEPPHPTFYTALGSAPGHLAYATLHVRTTGEPAGEVAAIRHELLALDPDLPFVNVQPLTELIEPQLAPWRMAALVFALFGALAVLLSAVGLYSVISFLVAQRTSEIGVRTALGADRRDIIRMVTGEGARAIAVGVVIGIVGALVTARILQGRLFGVSFFDPTTYVAVVLALVACGWLASWIPARRATRVDPVVALRAD